MSLRNGLVWLLFVALPALGADTEINVTNLTTSATMANTDTFLVRTGATKALRVVSAMTAKSAGSNVVGAVSLSSFSTNANTVTNLVSISTNVIDVSGVSLQGWPLTNGMLRPQADITIVDTTFDVTFATNGSTTKFMKFKSGTLDLDSQSASAPGLRILTNGSLKGWLSYITGNDAMRFSSAGSLIISPTNTGVGIGAFSTAENPTGMLEVRGNITGTGASNYLSGSLTVAGSLNIAGGSDPTIFTNAAVFLSTITGLDTSLTNAAGKTIAQQITNGDVITNSSGYGMISMADTNWVLAQVSQFGAYEYVGGPTNSFAITNSGETVSRTNVFTAAISPFVNAATQTVSSLAVNAYVRTVISTNKFERIAAGPVTIETYPFRSGSSGTVSGHYEFYAVDCVSNLMYELASSPTVIISATIPTLITTSMVVTNGFTATNKCYAAVTFKMDSVGTGSPSLSWAFGGIYPAHFNFTRPLSSATINGSQIVSPIYSSVLPNPLLTNDNGGVKVLWTNGALGTHLSFYPGLGLVKSNSTTSSFTLLGGTNGGINIGGNVPVGPGNLNATNQVKTKELQVTGRVVMTTNAFPAGVLGIDMSQPTATFTLKTNAAFAVGGYINTSAGGTNVDRSTVFFIGDGTARAVTLPANTKCNGGLTQYLTNLVIMTTWIHPDPAVGTNVAWLSTQ